MENVSFSLQQLRTILDCEEDMGISLVRLDSGEVLPFTQSGSNSNWDDVIYLGEAELFDPLELDQGAFLNITYILDTSNTSIEALERIVSLLDLDRLNKL